MVEYIERNRLLSKVHELFVQPHIELWQVVNLVSNAPTADVVEVIRCQNCARAVVLQHSDNVMCCGEKMPKDGFCSRGLRKAGDKL